MTPKVEVGDAIKVRVPGETPWATVAHVIAPGIVIARLQAVAAPEHNGLKTDYFLTFQWRNNPFTPEIWTWELGRDDEQVSWPKIASVGGNPNEPPSQIEPETANDPR
jgi:hypothetical protein